jgi:hypothetical protein
MSCSAYLAPKAATAKVIKLRKRWRGIIGGLPTPGAALLRAFLYTGETVESDPEQPAAFWSGHSDIP